MPKCCGRGTVIRGGRVADGAVSALADGATISLATSGREGDRP
jgi:hypothetical protein